MKLAKLIAVSDKMRKINARFVIITGYKNGFDRAQVPTAICRSYTRKEYKLGRVKDASDKNKYTTKIQFISRKYDVKVSCSCPDFTFRWEVANHRAGVSDIKYSNGEPPTTTNPNMKPGGCKHILAMAKFLKDKHGL